MSECVRLLFLSILVTDTMPDHHHLSFAEWL